MGLLFDSGLIYLWGCKRDFLEGQKLNSKLWIKDHNDHYKSNFVVTEVDISILIFKNNYLSTSNI